MKVTLHEYAPSGNCYKIRLTAAHLGVPLERRNYDIAKRETRTPEFLGGVNANGRIPVLEVDGRFLPESNAAVSASAGKKDSMASSDRVTSVGVPNTVVVERKLSRPTGESRIIGTAIGTGPAGPGILDAGAG